MKKIFLLSTILLAGSLAANAFIEETQTSSIETLRNFGYSESTLRIVDSVNAMNRGKHNYTRHFTPKYRGAYTSLKQYVDPIQDDGLFGEHQINFTNTWNGDETHYSLMSTDGSGYVENL